MEGANGCTATSTVSLTQPAQALNCNISSSISVACYGGNNGSAASNATGGTGPYQYNWSLGGGTTASISNLSAGSYTVTVNDANGCTTTAKATITQPQQLKCNVPTITNIGCDGGSTGSAIANSIGGTSPYTYNWFPGGGSTASVSNLSVGTYTVMVNDANGCTGSASVLLCRSPRRFLLVAAQP